MKRKQQTYGDRIPTIDELMADGGIPTADELAAETGCEVLAPPPPAERRGRLNQRQLTPAERALLPHAMFDENDLVVLQSALRCERALGAGPSQFTAALGLAPTWRSQSRRGRTREILASLPDMPVAAIRERLVRL